MSDSVVLVTGGAGGIGAAISRAFAAEGAHVVVHHHRSVEAAEQLAREIDGTTLPADLTSASEADALVTTTVERLGRLDACVANAGWWPPDDTPVWELDLDRFRSVVDRNLTVAFTTARSYLAHVAGVGQGSLVFTSSTAGEFGEAGHADYAAAKAALSYGFLRSLKNEAARIGDDVRVNAVAPGWTVTPRRAEAGVDPAHVDRATATMARKQLGTPEDVARQVVLLTSPVASRHITGQVITVAGGMEGRLIP